MCRTFDDSEATIRWTFAMPRRIVPQFDEPKALVVLNKPFALHEADAVVVGPFVRLYHGFTELWVFFSDDLCGHFDVTERGIEVLLVVVASNASEDIGAVPAIIVLRIK
jgi:hypothetical protein